MPVFSYTAIDNSGRELHGSLEAPTEDSLEALLRRRGQWLTRAEASSRRSLARQGGQAVPRRVMADFYLQLAMQLRAGIAIDTALEFYTRHDPGSKLSPVLDDVVLRLKSGTAFSEAMALHPRTFGAMAVNVFRAGEASGRMKEACDEMRKHLEWTDRIIAEDRKSVV